jgi:RNA polymerase sigma-70 factor (ECF subfamily)
MKLPRAEFERLALEQIDALDRVARAMTGSAQEAEDLVQETYLRAFRGQETFQLQSFGIKPWLLRILHNLHIDRGQKQSRQPFSVAADDLDLIASVEDAPFDGRSLEGADDRLVQSLAELAEEYRVVLMLWAVEELSYQEIADTLSVPMGTVMSRLHRAKRKLAEALRKRGVEPTGKRE